MQSKHLSNYNICFYLHPFVCVGGIVAIVFTFIAVGQAGFSQALTDYKPNLIQGDIIIRDARFYSIPNHKVILSDVFFNASGVVSGEYHSIQQNCRDIDFVFEGPNGNLCPTCQSQCLTTEAKRDAEMGCRFSKRFTCVPQHIQGCVVERLKEQRVIPGVTHVYQSCLDLQVATTESVYDIPGYVPGAGIIVAFIILSILACVKGVIYNIVMFCSLYEKYWNPSMKDPWERECECIVRRCMNNKPWQYDELPLRWFRSSNIHPIQRTPVPTPTLASSTTQEDELASANIGEKHTPVPIKNEPDLVDVSMITIQSLFSSMFHINTDCPKNYYGFDKTFAYFMKKPLQVRPIHPGENTQYRIKYQVDTKLSSVKIENVYYHCPYCDENISLPALISDMRLYNSALHKLKTGKHVEKSPCCNVLTPLTHIHEDLFILP